jgi:hypothetical protein
MEGLRAAILAGGRNKHVPFTHAAYTKGFPSAACGGTCNESFCVMAQAAVISSIWRFLVGKVVN